MENINKEFNGTLIYLVENCILAYDQLCKINKEFNEEFGKIQRQDFSSNVDTKNYLSDINRIIQDYLIIRVAGLFDKDKQNRGVVSFGKLFSENETYKGASEQEIIKYIKLERDNFVAHFNVNAKFPISSKICDSNLKEILLKLKTLVN